MRARARGRVRCFAEADFNVQLQHFTEVLRQRDRYDEPFREQTNTFFVISDLGFDSPDLVAAKSANDRSLSTSGR